MDWPGIRDDISALDPKGALTAQNVSFAVDGELRRRPGLGDRIDEGGVLVSEFQHPTLGAYAVFFTAAGALRAVNLSDNTEFTLASGLDTAYRGTFARSNGRLYFTNDFDVMQSVERGDVAARSAGIAGPVAAIGTPADSAGSTTAGVHLIRYSYSNSKSGYVSNPSDALSFTVVSGGRTLTFDIGTTGTDIIRSTDPKVDQVIIWMTATDGTKYYKATSVNQTASSVTVSIADTSLILLDLQSFVGEFGHEQPPLASLLTEHRGRLFAWGTTARTLAGLTVSSASAAVTGTGFSTKWAGRLITFGSETTQYRILSVASATALTLSEAYVGALTTGVAGKVFSSAPDMLYWSRAGYPESWKPAEWARRVLQNQADTPAGMASFYGDLYLFGQRSQRRLIYTSDPSTGQLINVPTEMGLWNQRCLVEADGKLFGWGRSGVWVIDGILPKHLSNPIDETIVGLYDTAQYEQYHAVYDPQERVITWFYVATGDAYPKSAFSLDLNSGHWSTRTFRQAIRAATLMAQGNEAVQALLSDEHGYSWFLEAGRFDCVPSTMTTGVLSCAAGSTTTVLQIASPGLGDLVGAILYQPSSGAERRITASTATTVTLASALTTAPALDAEVYVGSFTASWRTKWIAQDALRNKVRPSYVNVSGYPGTANGKLDVKIYADFATSPLAFTRTSSDESPDGVTYTDAGTAATVDLDGGSGDGLASVPIPQGWKRSLSILLTTDRPANDLRILEMGLAQTESNPEDGE